MLRLKNTKKPRKKYETKIKLKGSSDGEGWQNAAENGKGLK